MPPQEIAMLPNVTLGDSDSVSGTGRMCNGGTNRRLYDVGMQFIVMDTNINISPQDKAASCGLRKCEICKNIYMPGYKDVCSKKCYDRKRYLTNTFKILERVKKWRIENQYIGGKKYLYNKKWQEENRSKARASIRKYYKNNRDRLLIESLMRREKNRTKLKECSNLYHLFGTQKVSSEVKKIAATLRIAKRCVGENRGKYGYLPKIDKTKLNEKITKINKGETREAYI